MASQPLWPADRVERWPIGRLIPYVRNARTHSDAQVAQIAASIREWGWTTPVLCDEAGGMIAGHGRVLAARQLGITEVPVMVARGWSEAQKRAYILADNKLTLNAGWDEEMLRVELADLKGLGADLSLTGFSDDELAGLLVDRTAGLTDPDEAPEAPGEPVTVLGDVWVMGRHRLVCGDSTDAATVATVMGEQKADLIVTDPPYGVAFERGKFVGRDKAAKGPKYAPIANDELKGTALAEFLRNALVRGYDVAKDAPIYVWSPPLSEGAAILSAVQQAGFHVQSQIVWRKTPFVIGRADYHWQHEVCWYRFKGKNHPWFGGRNKGTVWDCPKPQKVDLHPTMKPVQLIATTLENSSKGGDLVLDLFAGSGTLAIACEQLGREARMVELSPVYVDVTVLRWQAFTGQQATLEATGQTFDEVRGERLAAAASDERTQADPDSGSRGTRDSERDKASRGQGARAEAAWEPR